MASSSGYLPPMIRWLSSVFRSKAIPAARPVEAPSPSLSGATLIIPDVHNDFACAEAVIGRLAGRYEWIVFLGDYFDDTGDSPETARRVAEWLKRSLEQPERVHLVGNHDLAYLCPGSFTRCSGFTPEKLRAAAPILDLLPREKLRAAITVDGWLLSHAGFHPRHASGRTAVELVEWANESWRQMAAGARPAVFAAGAARGGPAQFGGITWCDWGREFLPTAGLHQIVGHTEGDTVRIRVLDSHRGQGSQRELAIASLPGEEVAPAGNASVNVCLDARLTCAGLLAAGKLTFVPIPSGP